MLSSQGKSCKTAGQQIVFLLRKRNMSQVYTTSIEHEGDRLFLIELIDINPQYNTLITFYDRYKFRRMTNLSKNTQN